ncbi:YcaO-like family protein [Variovorax paradoxus]|uniref:YcaO-like family protein n=1 Tax=Variovorax paradoxus TaxID=34073 RepID=UPI00278591F8|nr:YcaO-like family protein [Variovorax paradoxus]MDP9933601.1 ribosomal protein S12 methylthiotransferase accessory factor [Variovorax paradoxus]
MNLAENPVTATPAVAEIRPALARACLIKGGTLVVRLPERELSVRAPARFLRALFDWCDGRRTFAEVVALAEAKWPDSRFEEFLREMLECGVLVDAHFALLNALSDERRQREQLTPSSKFSPAPSEGESATVLPSMAALTTLLGELFCSASALAVPLVEERRPTPLRAAVALREPINGKGPGIFHVTRPNAELLWRPAGPLDEAALLSLAASPYAVSRSPIVLIVFAGGRFSTEGHMLPADMALMAAGAAMQRMRSRAQELGLQWQPIHVLDAEAMRALCGIERSAFVDMVLIGASAPGQTKPAAPAPRAITVRWRGAGDELRGSFVAEAVVHSKEKPEKGWGRSIDARVACAIAVSEAVERYCFRHPHAELRCAQGRQFDSKLDPRSLAQFSEDQYRRAHGLLVPYSEDLEHLWITGKDLDTGNSLWVPADCVYSGSDLPAPCRSRMLMRQTSSGCASDVSLSTALERAGLEIVERDALARHWLAQQPGTGILLNSLPQTLQSQVNELHARGCEVDVCILNGSLGPVMIVAVTSPAKGFCAIATVCGNSAKHALERALREAQITALVKLARAPEPSASRVAVRAVRTPLDHAQVFSQRTHYRKAHAITRGPRTTTFSSVEREWPDSLEERLKRCADRPMAAWVDMTRSDAPLSLDGQAVRTVRVLIPGAVPIAFGYDALPRGMGAACVPRGRFPHPLP